MDADDPDPTARRVDDDVGHPPAQLLGELETHRLLALDPVGLLERRGPEPARARGHRPSHGGAGVGYRPAHPVDLGTRQHHLRAGDGRGVVGQHHQRAHPRARRVGRPRRARVAVGRHGQRAHPELVGPRHPDRGAPTLEAPRRQHAFVLDEQPGDAELGAEAPRGQQRGEPLPQGHHVRAVPDGQQLVVAPQVRGPSADLRRGDRCTYPGEVVAGQQRCSRGREVLHHVGVDALPGPRALQVGQVAVGHAHRRYGGACRESRGLPH